MFDLKNLFRSFLPLDLDCVAYDGENLLVSGVAWRFSCSSAWRVSRGRDLLFTFLDGNSIDLLKDFRNLSVVDMNWLIEKQPIDPSFLFSDGRRIDVFCSYLYDSWVMELPSGDVYIGNS